MNKFYGNVAGLEFQNLNSANLNIRDSTNNLHIYSQSIYLPDYASSNILGVNSLGNLSIATQAGNLFIYNLTANTGNINTLYVANLTIGQMSGNVNVDFTQVLNYLSANIGQVNDSIANLQANLSSWLSIIDLNISNVTNTIVNLQANLAAENQYLVNNMNANLGVLHQDLLNIGGALNVANAINNNAYNPMGRMYVSQPTTIIDSQFTTNFLPLYDYTYTTGWSVNANTSILNGTLAGSGNIIFQTKQRTYYQPSKPIELIMTTQLHTNVNATSNTYLGLFDDQNGLFIGYDNTSGNIATWRRTSTSGAVVNNKTERASWNGSTLQGIDFTKEQVLRLRLLWFGYAFYEWALYNSGNWTVFQMEYFTNSSTVPYIQTPNNPVRAQIQSSAGAQGLNLTCFAASILGDIGPTVREFVVTRNLVSTTITTPFRPLCAIRLKSGYSKSAIAIKAVRTVGTNAADVVQVTGRILYADAAAAVTGATWVSYPDSTAEYALAPTSFSAANSSIIYNDIYYTGARTVSGNNVMAENYITANLSGNTDIFVLSGNSSGSTPMYFTLVYADIY